jgi:uncharacterized RDD family membrane protein YckC
MRALFLSPFRHRLAISAALSFALIFLFFALVVISSTGDWRKAGEDFKKWDSGQGKRCEALFSNAQDELKAIDNSECDLSNGFGQYSVCSEFQKFRRMDLIATVSRSDCPSYQWRDELPTLLPMKDPGSLVEYAIQSNGHEVSVIPISFAVLTAFFVLLTDVIRRILTESHVGWKRLSLIVSILTGLGTLGWWLNDGKHPEESAVAGLVALSISGLLLIYGRLVVLWVIAGFKENQPAASSAHSSISSSSVVATIPSREVADPIPGPELDDAVYVAASFWPRFWARCFDLPICWLGASVALIFLPDIRSSVGGLFGVMVDLLTGMVFICGFALLYEAFFISRFGATPGKMLFRLSVASIDGGLPSWDLSKRRAWIYLKSGLYFALFPPILQFFGAVAAWKRKEGSQPWDIAARTCVRQRSVGAFRFIVAVLVSFCLISLMVVTNKVLKEFTKEDIRRSIH